jgi:hypothetical protein
MKAKSKGGLSSTTKATAMLSRSKRRRITDAEIERLLILIGRDLSDAETAR